MSYAKTTPTRSFTVCSTLAVPLSTAKISFTTASSAVEETSYLPCDGQAGLTHSLATRWPSVFAAMNTRAGRQVYFECARVSRAAVRSGSKSPQETERKSQRQSAENKSKNWKQQTRQTEGRNETLTCLMLSQLLRFLSVPG